MDHICRLEGKIFYKERGDAIPGGEVIQAQLPIYHGTLAGLPEGIDALIVTSDLQGIVPVMEKESDAASDRESVDKLLGEMLPAYIRLLMEVEWLELDPQKVGVLLCGDMYALPGKRGASGNPVPVWLAFRAAFGWVAGVHGNHDLTDDADAHRLHRSEGIHCMDGPAAILSAGPLPGGLAPHAARLGQLRIAGLGGGIGRPGRKRLCSAGIPIGICPWFN